MTTTNVAAFICVCVATAVAVCHGQGLPRVSQQADWILTPHSKYPAKVVKDGNTIVLTNNLIERTFLISPNFCTVDYRNLVSGERFFRSLSPEANTTFDNIHNIDIGGCVGPPDNHRELFNPSQWTLKTNPGAFQFINYTVKDIEAPFHWVPGTRHSPKDIDWPPKGVHFTAYLGLTHKNLSEYADVVAAVHYILYDGIPVLTKRVSFHREATADFEPLPMINVSSLTLELLRVPNFAPRRIFVESLLQKNMLFQSEYYIPFDERVQDGFWNKDPLYDQCCDQELHVPYSVLTYLVVGYGSYGPGAILTPGQSFHSSDVTEILFDSDDLERQGLSIRQYSRTTSPQVLENPLYYMLSNVSSAEVFRTAVDQAAAVGMELVIISFGADGWCGMCNGQILNETFRAWFKEQVDYAHSKNILVSAYTLMQHNGWGENVPASEQVVNPETGKPQGIACFATEWHATYRSNVLQFLEATGLDGIETDGEYEGAICASTEHQHYGQADSWYKQSDASREFNVNLKVRNTYQTSADAYTHSGVNKWNHGDTDSWGRVTNLGEHMDVGRMYLYDSTYFRPITSGGLSIDHKFMVNVTLRNLDWMLANYFGQGNLGYVHGSYLYEPGALTMQAAFKKWITFYKNHRTILTSVNLIHIQRPSGRDFDMMLHLDPSPDATERGFSTVFNPTEVAITSEVALPLYYGNFAYGDAVNVTWIECGDPAETHIVGQEGGSVFDIVLKFTVDAFSYKSFALTPL